MKLEQYESNQIVSISSHLDERSFEQLLAAAFALQQQQRGPVLVPPNAKAAHVPGASQRKAVQMAVSKSSANNNPTGAAIPVTSSGALPRKHVSAEAEEAMRLAAIADTHTSIHKNNLGLSQALQLIAACASDITRASAAAVWLREGGSAVCRAASGTHKNAVGQNMEIAPSRLAACFERDEVLRIWNAKTETTEFEGPELGTAGGCLLAVPIHHEGKVEGALEVAFPRSRHFTDADLRTCQILSGLVSEAIALAAGQERRHVLDSERAKLLQALDLIQPHLTRLLSEAEGKAEAKKEGRRELRPVPESSNRSARSSNMARLGEYLLTQQSGPVDADENVPEEYLDDSDLETEQLGSEQTDREDANSWQIHSPLSQQPPYSVRRAPREVQTALNLSVAPALRSAQESDSVPSELTQTEFTQNDNNIDPATTGTVRYTNLLKRTNETLDHPISHADSQSILDHDLIERSILEPSIIEPSILDEEVHDSSDLVVYPEPVYSEPETLATGDLKTSLLKFWKQRWADACLAVSAALLAVSLVWAFWPHPTGPGRQAGQPALTPFEQLLVAVGLAEEATPISVYAGSPEAQVWVDMHTALYYCSGAGEYGKTEKGKFLTQHEAQYEQFQPASGRACD